MHHPRTRILALFAGVALLTLATGAPAALAQTGDEAGAALCDALPGEGLAELLGGRYRAEPGFESCTWNLDAPFYVSAYWQTGSLEESKQFWTPGEDVTVGDRPAWLAKDLGVLLIQLDDGVIVLNMPTFGTGVEDAGATFLQLGEMLVSGAATLTGPATPEPFTPPSSPPLSHADPDLEALFPQTAAGQPLTLQSMSGEALLSGDEEDVQRIEDALAAQGKTVADLSFGVASAADFSSAVYGIRVKGGDAAALVEPLVAGLIEDGAVRSEVEVAGRAVTVLTNAGVSQYVYPKGEVLWVVTATEPALSELVAALP